MCTLLHISCCDIEVERLPQPCWILLDIAGCLCQRSNELIVKRLSQLIQPGALTLPVISSTPLVQQYRELETNCHSYLQRKVSALHCLHSPTGKTMARHLQMAVIPPTLFLLLVAGWPKESYSWPQSLWTLHECLCFRGPLPNPWGWLTEPLGFGRTPVKNHCSTTLRNEISVQNMLR